MSISNDPGHAAPSCTVDILLDLLSEKKKHAGLFPINPTRIIMTIRKFGFDTIQRVSYNQPKSSLKAMPTIRYDRSVYYLYVIHSR